MGLACCRSYPPCTLLALLQWPAVLARDHAGPAGELPCRVPLSRHLEMGTRCRGVVRHHYASLVLHALSPDSLPGGTVYPAGYAGRIVEYGTLAGAHCR